MAFDDLLDDSKAKSGSLAAFRRNIWLEQPGTILLRQSHPVIDDLDDCDFTFTPHMNFDAPLVAIRALGGFGDSLHAFHRILHEIGQRLRQEPPVGQQQ